MKSVLIRNTYLNFASFGVALALAGCGGGGDKGSSSSNTAPADVSMYAALTTYCDTSVPTNAVASQDSWQLFPMRFRSIDTVGRTGTYVSSSMVSPAGSTAQLTNPITLNVPVSDYRGVTSAYVGASSGYGSSIDRPVMGVSVPTTLSANSVACVSQVTRVERPIDYFVGVPNVPKVDTTPTLNWRSYWDKNVPINALPEFHVDGFEFVSNYVPVDGQVYFTLNKTSFPTPQNLSVCYLAPKTTKWDCQQPSVADQGTNWNLYLRGAKPGVYVLNSSTAK